PRSGWTKTRNEGEWDGHVSPRGPALGAQLPSPQPGQAPRRAVGYPRSGWRPRLVSISRKVLLRPGQAGTAILPDAPRVRGAARSPNNRSDSRFRDSSRFRVAALSRYALSRSSHRRHSGDDEMLQSVGTTRPGRLCALASLAAALFALPRPARAEIIN